MLVIKKACDEMKELLYEAKERVELAIYCKSDYPMLASTYIELANSCLTNVDKLHSAVVDLIEKEKAKSDTPQAMLELWKYEHKVYVEKYEKAKLKIAMYSKM